MYWYLAVELIAFLVALLLGVGLAHTWARFYSLLALGLFIDGLLAVAIILRSPTGEGWSGRSEVLGHWVASAPLGAFALAWIPWIVGLTLGTFLWLLSRDRRASADA
jgi:hypothetical protein